MAIGKTNGGAGDVSAQRLLEAIGSAGLDYFSVADERAVTEALQSWPLLAAITRTLGVERAAHERDARRAAGESVDPPLRVVEAAEGASFDCEPIEEADVCRPPDSQTKEN